MKALFALPLVFLAACSALPGSEAALGQAVENIKQAEDNKARTTLRGPCLAPVGAAKRVLTDEQYRLLTGPVVDNFCK